MTMQRAHALLTDDAGEIDRRVFSDPDLFQMEMGKIFNKTWLFVGHESQIPQVGDFIQSRMGVDSVIVTRDREGTIRVLLNTCRHRGMKVCRYDEGNTRLFYCPYHAWTYDLSGRLVNLPHAENYESFDKARWSLKQAPHVTSFRGFIWATWDEAAQPFEEYLGDLRQPLWDGLGPWDGGDGEVEIISGTLKWIVPCNWKIIAENFAGDPLHEPSHASVNRVRLGPGGRRDPLGKLFLTHFPTGHGFVVEQFDPSVDRGFYAASPATAEYHRISMQKRYARLGERAGTPLVLGTVFPNAAIHTSQPRTLMVAHPLTADKTEMWRMFFVDKDAPQEVKDYLRRYYMAYGGPGGMTEQDDMENWTYAFQATLSDNCRTLPFNYGAALKMQPLDTQIAGTVSAELMSEQNTRNYYKVWAACMDKD